MGRAETHRAMCRLPTLALAASQDHWELTLIVTENVVKHKDSKGQALRHKATVAEANTHSPAPRVPRAGGGR